jgi:hypothetical protein
MLSTYKQFTIKLLEKSSLTALGVPKEVMQNIQKDYALRPDADWVEYTLKKNIKDELIKNKNVLFVQIGDDSIKIYCSVYENKRKFYLIDRYIKYIGEWGEHWEKNNREGITLTQLLIEINSEPKYKKYKLKDDIFSVVKSDIRNIEKSEKEFENFNIQFKKYLINYFTKVLKNSHSKASKRIEKTIINNLAKVKIDLTPEDIKQVLYQNVDLATKTKKHQQKAEDIPKYKLDNEEVQFNSLTIFNEFLLQFEEEYSEKYNEYYTVKNLVEKYSKDKIISAFIYYLYTGSLMDLNSYKPIGELDDLFNF